MSLIYFSGKIGKKLINNPVVGHIYIYIYTYQSIDYGGKIFNSLIVSWYLLTETRKDFVCVFIHFTTIRVNNDAS